MKAKAELGDWVLLKREKLNTWDMDKSRKRRVGQVVGLTKYLSKTQRHYKGCERMYHIEFITKNEIKEHLSKDFKKISKDEAMVEMI